MKLKGRGAVSNPPGRFARLHRERDPQDQPPSIATTLTSEVSRSIITRNRSPDLPFSQSINPYRGCEHGCVYCYARAGYAYLELSPGQDFETRLFFKPDARRRLLEALARPGYRVSPIVLGANTDPYQPIERELRITRDILEVLLQARHPVTIVTKGSLIERDLDLLAELAALKLASVLVSLTTLDDELKRRMEPRTASPRRRLETLRRLGEQGIPTGVLLAPIIPALNDHEIERMLESAAQAGARSANYVLIRLPHEVKSLFGDWLRAHYPDRAEHVLSLIRQMRGGRLNDPRFHSRQRGSGVYAQLLEARFARARRALGLACTSSVELETKLFGATGAVSGQLELWSR